MTPSASSPPSPAPRRAAARPAENAPAGRAASGRAASGRAASGRGATPTAAAPAAAKPAPRRRAAAPRTPLPAPAPVADEVTADGCRQWRAPQHARGQRRVDAILDAASAILVEGGVGALTVDAVAKRSGTSKSSMYHFFPDRDAIVGALADRHVASLARYGGFAAPDAVDWSALTVEETVDRYLQPFRRYLADHPDIIPCMEAASRVSGQSDDQAVLDAMELERAERVIAARFPSARPAERRVRAATLFAVTVGSIKVTSRLANGPPQAAAMRELRRVLIGYLRVLEDPPG